VDMTRSKEWCQWLFRVVVGEDLLGDGVVVRVLGKGAYGAVLSCIFSRLQAARAVKCARTISPSEVELQNVFALYGLAPKCSPDISRRIYFGAAWDRIHMDSIEKTADLWVADHALDPGAIPPDQILLRRLVGFLNLLERHRLTHGDMHLGNVAIRISPRETRDPEAEPGDLVSPHDVGNGRELTLIDFGYAYQGASCRFLELVQLFRGGCIAIEELAETMLTQMKRLDRKVMGELSWTAAMKRLNDRWGAASACFERFCDALWKTMHLDFPLMCGHIFRIQSGSLKVKLDGVRNWTYLRTLVRSSAEWKITLWTDELMDRHWPSHLRVLRLAVDFRFNGDEDGDDDELEEEEEDDDEDDDD
jgi:hypothetical protein